MTDIKSSRPFHDSSSALSIRVASSLGMTPEFPLFLFCDVSLLIESFSLQLELI
jgi:hypothetical protein